jgi:recombination protein RecA
MKITRKEPTVPTRAQELLDQINATLKGPVLMMGSDKGLTVEYWPTGVLPIDILLQGGIPKGRFVTFTGDFSTLKSFIGLKAIATTQASGGTCALIDTEHSFDPLWATELGVNIDELILMHPESGELAMDAAEVLIRNGIDLIVFDSVAAALPQAERNKRLHDESVQPARIAALMSIAMRRLTAANRKTAILWINQLRLNVGITFGNPEVATGGRALPYYSSYIVNIKKTGKINNAVKTWDGEKWIDTKEQVGQKFRAVVEKSKLSAPHRETHFIWDHMESGVDEVSFVIAQGLERGYISQKGASWEFGGVKVRGKDAFKKRLKDDLGEYQRLRTLVSTPKETVSSSTPKSAKGTTGRSGTTKTKRAISRTGSPGKQPTEPQSPKS